MISRILEKRKIKTKKLSHKINKDRTLPHPESLAIYHTAFESKATDVFLSTAMKIAHKTFQSNILKKNGITEAETKNKNR